MVTLMPPLPQYTAPLLDVRRRLQAILSGAPAQPVAAFWKHHPLADQAADSLVRSTVQFQRETGCDLVKLTPAGNYQVAQRGMLESWNGDPLGRRTISGPAIRQVDDWSRLVLDTTALEWAMVAAARQLRDELGPQPVLLASVFAPLTQALMLAGADTLQQHLRSAPAAVLGGLEVLTRNSLHLIEAYREAGVDGLYLASQHHAAAQLERSLYARWGLAFDQRLLQAGHGFAINILHLHGSGIHLDGVPAGGPWMVHYELGPENPAPEALRALSACPAVLGLPCSRWLEGALQPDVQDWLARFGQASALLTAECVVPLAISNAQIGRWVAEVERAA